MLSFHIEFTTAITFPFVNVSVVAARDFVLKGDRTDNHTTYPLDCQDAYPDDSTLVEE